MNETSDTAQLQIKNRKTPVHKALSRGYRRFLASEPTRVGITGGDSSGEVIIHCVAGHPIQLAPYANAAGPPYSIRAIVERLRLNAGGRFA